MRKPKKNPAAVALGRLGGLANAGRGPRKRWAEATPEQRAEQGRKMAEGRARARAAREAAKKAKP